MKSEKSNHIDMDKASLKKLSKSELIKMLLKSEAKQKKPEIIVVDDYKPVPKNKQKKIYNHNNIFDDDPFPEFVINDPVPFEKRMNKVKKMSREIEATDTTIDKRYNKLTLDFKPEHEIRDYPMIKTTLDKLRKDEMKLSTDKRKAKMSFLKLFKTRLDMIPGKRETVSVTIVVEIENDNKEKSTKTTRGPFAVEKPVYLSIPDTYKFAMYTLLNTKFNILSGEHISRIGVKIIKLEKKNTIKQKMGQLKLESYLLNKQRPIKSHGVNTCRGLCMGSSTW